MPLLQTSKALILVGDIDNDIGSGLLAAAYSDTPPTLILINSGGGDASLAHALACELCEIPNLHTRVAGWCASAALSILLAGTRRSATWGSDFLTHQLTAEMDAVSPPSLAAYAALFQENEAVWAQYTALRTGHEDAEWWANWFKEERWFGDVRARELGILTE